MTEHSIPPAATAGHVLSVAGDDVAVWDRPGDGLPIVLLHGNTASKEAFRPLFESPPLANHRLIAFDLPGCGASADARRPEETYTLPGLGEIVCETIRRAGASRFVLVGWSLGGHLAIQTLLHELRPEGMVLTGTPPCGPDPAEIAAAFLPVAGSEVMSMEAPTAEQMATFLASVYAPSSPTQALRRDAARADGRLRQRLFAHIFATPDLEPQRVTIAKYEGPVALIQGRDEPFFRPAELEALAWRKLWRGATQWIEDAGHAPFFTRPDAYAAALKAFADDVAAGAAP